MDRVILQSRNLRKELLQREYTTYVEHILHIVNRDEGIVDRNDLHILLIASGAKH